MLLFLILKDLLFILTRFLISQVSKNASFCPLSMLSHKHWLAVVVLTIVWSEINEYPKAAESLTRFYGVIFPHAQLSFSWGLHTPVGNQCQSITVKSICNETQLIGRVNINPEPMSQPSLGTPQQNPNKVADIWTLFPSCFISVARYQTRIKCVTSLSDTSLLQFYSPPSLTRTGTAVRWTNYTFYMWLQLTLHVLQRVCSSGLIKATFSIIDTQQRSSVMKQSDWGGWDHTLAGAVADDCETTLGWGNVHVIRPVAIISCLFLMNRLLTAQLVLHSLSKHIQ